MKGLDVPSEDVIERMLHQNPVGEVHGPRSGPPLPYIGTWALDWSLSHLP